MKKIFFTLALLAIAVPCALAGLGEGRTTDNDVLLRTNYSPETVRLVDLIRYQNNYDEDYKYTRIYRKETPRKYDGFGFYYNRLKAYFDPMADDHLFGEHWVNYYNKPLQLEPNLKEFHDMDGCNRCMGPEGYNSDDLDDYEWL